MTSIKLTVKRLYRLRDERMVSTKATVRVWVGDHIIATEQIEGMTESPVSKYLHHELPTGQPVHVDWECEGIADMVVKEMVRCPCCHPLQAKN